MPSNYLRKQKTRKIKKKIIISMEGEILEQNYFNALINFIKKTNIELICLPSDSKSSPEHVRKRIDEFIKKENIKIEKSIDEFWIVIDIDRWQKTVLTQLNKIAKQKNYNIADSYKCFEVWLLFHKFNLKQLEKEALSTSKTYKKFLKKNFPGIYKENYDFEEFFLVEKNLKIGIKNAKKEDENSPSGWLMSIGTRVYKFMKLSTMRTVQAPGPALLYDPAYHASLCTLSQDHLSEF